MGLPSSSCSPVASLLNSPVGILLMSFLVTSVGFRMDLSTASKYSMALSTLALSTPSENSENMFFLVASIPCLIQA